MRKRAISPTVGIALGLLAAAGVGSLISIAGGGDQSVAELAARGFAYGTMSAFIGGLIGLISGPFAVILGAICTTYGAYSAVTNGGGANWAIFGAGLIIGGLAVGKAAD